MSQNSLKKWFACLGLALLMLISPSFAAASDKVSFPTVRLQAGMHLINAEVASTPSQREQGLMFRKKMAANDGMLFDFGAPASVCMWMKNTYIPLSVAFIDADGVIVNIEHMKPMTRQSHCSKKLVRYALEMNQGWFEQKKIEPGGRITGLQ